MAFSRDKQPCSLREGLPLSSGGDGACGSSQGGECAGGGAPGVAVRGSWGAPCLGEMNPSLWFLSACRQLCKEESALNPKQFLPTLYSPFPVFLYKPPSGGNLVWRCLRGSGWTLTSGVQAAGSQGAGWEGSPRVAPAGMKRCAGISRLASRITFKRANPVV